MVWGQSSMIDERKLHTIYLLVGMIACLLLIDQGSKILVEQNYGLLCGISTDSGYCGSKEGVSWSLGQKKIAGKESARLLLGVSYETGNAILKRPVIGEFSYILQIIFNLAIFAGAVFTLIFLLISLIKHSADRVIYQLGLGFSFVYLACKAMDLMRTGFPIRWIAVDVGFLWQNLEFPRFALADIAGFLGLLLLLIAWLNHSFAPPLPVKNTPKFHKAIRR